MAGLSRTHQTILLELSSLLSSYVKKKGSSCEVLPAPFNVKLSDTPLTIVQPDFLIVCDQDKLDEKRCNGAPDFIIEIVSQAIRQMIISVKRTTIRITEYGNIGSLTRNAEP